MVIHLKKYFEKLYRKSSREYYIQLSKYLDNNIKKFIITANPETIKIAGYDKLLERELLNSENDILPDGIAVVKACKHYKIDIKERITGYDTAINLLELANQKKKSVYFFGAEEVVLTSLKKAVKEKYPCIKILGATNGYIDNIDEEFERIIKLNPDICLVALGIPMQEHLIANHIKNAKKGIFIGVGGTFDVLSGVKKRAPKILIKLNLEWLYRILKEPKRLKRFYNNNIKFILDVYFDKKEK